jgi:predicted dehydrogenase
MICAWDGGRSEMRIGLVGYGAWTRDAYIPALRTSGRASVVAAAARSASTRQRIQAELGSGVPVFDGIEALLGGPRLDAVMIAVPDSMHEAVLSAALGAGVPALYEPPLSHNRGHLPRMIARLLSASQVTHADLELRFIPAVTRAAQLLKTGILGNMETVGMRLEASWQAEAGNELSTVGRLTPWYVDVLNAIVGAAPRRVFVIDGRGNAGRAQNFSRAQFDYGEVGGSFEISLASMGDLSVSVEARGADGELALDLFSGEVRFRSRRNPDWSVESWPAQAPYAGWPGMHESVTSFLESVENHVPGPNGALKMAQLNQVALAAEESKDRGAWADVQPVAADVVSM